MPAYIVFHNRITDPAAMDEYIPKATELIMSAGGQVLVVADQCDVLEGSMEHPRTIIIRFDTREAAEAFYDSPEYKDVREIRLGATEGYGVLVDGFA